MSAPVLLVIDDQPGLFPELARQIASTGYRAIHRRGAADALALLANEPVDVALVDLGTSALGGLEAIGAIRHLQPECGVVLMTCDPSDGRAIQAVKLGALDYLAKPLDLARLQQLLNAARDDMSRRAELLTSESATARRLELCGLIGRSGVMQQLFGLVRRLAPFYVSDRPLSMDIEAIEEALNSQEFLAQLLDLSGLDEIDDYFALGPTR